MGAIDIIRNKLAEFDCVDLAVVNALQEIEKKLFLYKEIEKTLYDSELYLVYKHTDPVGKVYIGITKNLPNSRWNEGAGYEKQTKFYKAIQKYGWMHFRHEIIAAGLSEDEARKIENDTIVAFRAYDEKYGYNTKVSLPSEEMINCLPDTNSKSVPEQAEKAKNTIDPNAVASSIIAKFSIKTVNGKMYWMQNERYIHDQNIKGRIKQELLVTHNLPPHKHADIIERIKILSIASFTEPSYAIAAHTAQDVLTEFLQSLAVSFATHSSISNEELYNLYVLWAKQHKTEILEKMAFAQRVAQVIKAVYPNATRYRTSNSRGWRNAD